MRWLVMAFFVALPLGSAAAGNDADADSVAVLPLSSATKSLQVYGRPIAKAVAARLDKVDGLSATVVTDTASLKGKVRWIIDGRIVDVGAGNVLLEARLRDPVTGLSLRTLATGSRKLARIEELADELSSAVRAAVVQPRRPSRPAPDGAREPPPTDSAGEGAGPSTAPEAAPPRPKMVILRAAGPAAARSHLVREPATKAAAAFAQSLGFDVIVSERDRATPTEMSKLLASHGAQHGLVTRVSAIEFEWLGVLTARGKVRFILVDHNGKTMADRTFKTDTLVGSRGDFRAALVYFVTEQAGTMAMPAMRKALKP